MRVYPENALTQLEFDKITAILLNYCQTNMGVELVNEMRIHTHQKYIEEALRQTEEFKFIKLANQYFPTDFVLDIRKDLKLLGIPGAQLTGEQWLLVRRLGDHIQQVFKWFDAERQMAYSNLYEVVKSSYYEKAIIECIDSIIDDRGSVKDNASEDLAKIRHQLFKKRQELRRIFEKVVQRLAKSGYTADIDESFSNGRRVVAVFSEYKRQVKGFLHGESDSRKTAFIEPEETIELNNELYGLEQDELKEVQKILRALTAQLAPYSSLLLSYAQIIGSFDFIRAKALLAIDMNANRPMVHNKAITHLIEAYHPLLYIYNKTSGKKTIPVNLELDDEARILIISGPNAGGKTVSMKTLGLNQVMLQSGLLVPMSATSQMGIYKQLFIQLGDTQNLAFELSTYSSHLLHMKHFIENANGKTLFFIDELGSGSDPHLGGAFAEVILEELSHRHAQGIVTTHYLNLKVMANHNKGIINGAMQFDEVKLEPLYQLVIGKPGSSYTFAIAERIGLPKHLINRARKLVDSHHFELDNLLNRTEQDLQLVQQERKDLHKKQKENEQLQTELKKVLDKEKHVQQIELLKEQNRVAEEKFAYLKDMERKIKQIALDWKKSEKKEEVMKNLYNLLFKTNDKIVINRLAKKVDKNYKELAVPIVLGSMVKLKKNYQVGEVIGFKGKRAIVKVGQLPMNIDLEDLMVVEKIDELKKK
ncbi:MAG: DNA mismatch repair protein MutS [Bacteroidetes bacterium]|nr:DNA mismatch repair protein MutS [Bacteroidota bacterium]